MMITISYALTSPNIGSGCVTSVLRKSSVFSWTKPIVPAREISNCLRASSRLANLPLGRPPSGDTALRLRSVMRCQNNSSRLGAPAGRDRRAPRSNPSMNVSAPATCSAQSSTDQHPSAGQRRLCSSLTPAKLPRKSCRLSRSKARSLSLSAASVRIELGDGLMGSVKIARNAKSAKKSKLVIARNAKSAKKFKLVHLVINSQSLAMLAIMAISSHTSTGSSRTLPWGSNGQGLPSRCASNSLRHLSTIDMVGMAAASPSGQKVRPNMFCAR